MLVYAFVNEKNYATDLSDEEWTCLKNHLPASKLPTKMRTHALREIFDAIFYVLKSGCPWRLLPGSFPPWQTVFYHFRRFRLSGLWHRVFAVPRAILRKRDGKDPNPSAAIMDSQSVKTTEESAGRQGQDAHRNGYDGHKHIKGRKRHLLVDTLGLPFSVYVSPADTQDRVGARWLLAGLKPLAPRLKKIWVDGANSGDPLSQWCQEEGRWELEVVDRNREASGFQVVPKRWIVERTISWIGQNRRMSKDYERLVQTSETLIEVAMIRLILKRLAKGT
jgi:putative transposase